MEGGRGCGTGPGLKRCLGAQSPLQRSLLHRLPPPRPPHATPGESPYKVTLQGERWAPGGPVEEQREKRENPKPALHPAQTATQASISQPQDHELSQNQRLMFNSLSQPGTPSRPFSDPGPLQPPYPAASTGPYHCKRFPTPPSVTVCRIGAPLPTCPQSCPLLGAKGPAPAFLLQNRPDFSPPESGLFSASWRTPTSQGTLQG